MNQLQTINSKSKKIEICEFCKKDPHFLNFKHHNNTIFLCLKCLRRMIKNLLK